MSRLGWFGVFVTAAYIGVFWWLFGAQVSQIKTLEPNELGDFFAGVFGPVALFWVVLGFFQQGVELRHSVETLKLQAEELKNSVDQQRELVQVSRDQIDLEKMNIAETRKQYLKSIEPDFTLRVSGGSGNGENFTHVMEIVNNGDDALAVMSKVSPDTFAFQAAAIDIFRRGEKFPFQIRFFESVRTSGVFKVEICALNRDRQKVSQIFELSLNTPDATGSFTSVDIKKLAS